MSSHPIPGVLITDATMPSIWSTIDNDMKSRNKDTTVIISHDQIAETFKQKVWRWEVDVDVDVDVNGDVDGANAIYTYDIHSFTDMHVIGRKN